MLSTYAIVVIGLFAACILTGLVIGIRNFIELEVQSLHNNRNEPYEREEYTRKVIKRKGYTKKAEKLMRDAYNYYLTHKSLSFEDKYKVFYRAYKQAFELVRSYMDDDEYDFIRSLSCYDLDACSDMYKHFFGYDTFDPYTKVRHILS